jgi:hypothetical protein
LLNRVAASLANLPRELVCPENVGMLSIQCHKHLSHLAWEWQGGEWLSQANLQRCPLWPKSLQYLGLLGENSKTFGQVRWVLRA